MTLGPYVKTANSASPKIKPVQQRQHIIATTPVVTKPIMPKLPPMPIMTAKSIALALVVVGGSS